MDSHVGSLNAPRSQNSNTKTPDQERQSRTEKGSKEEEHFSQPSQGVNLRVAQNQKNKTLVQLLVSPPPSSLRREVQLTSSSPPSMLMSGILGNETPTPGQGDPEGEDSEGEISGGLCIWQVAKGLTLAIAVQQCWQSLPKRHRKSTSKKGKKKYKPTMTLVF